MEDIGLITIITIISLIAGALVGSLIGQIIATPTELPNGCILYEDAIYCVEEATE